jgi:GNAT superfamily N-acetyltransferase
MAGIAIRDMQPDDEYYVSTCSHVGESDEIDVNAEDRRALFRDLATHGGRFKVARIDGEPAAFAYGLPIDRASWGPLGEGLMVIPCLFVPAQAAGKGIGRALIEAIERDARAAGYAGVTLTAYRDIPGAEWFMPTAYFERLGYRSVGERGREVLLWKPFGEDAVPPRFLEPQFTFEPIEGVCVVDLFWNRFCQTSGIEAQRVREVCAEFGDRVLLREYPAENRAVLPRYQTPRAIYVDGREIGWGYEAPREGIRAAIERALGGPNGTD